MPSAPVSVAISLADKFDTLIGFFDVGEKPTGSKDPFALRRAALGVIRLVVATSARLELRPLIRSHLPRLEETYAHVARRYRQVGGDTVYSFGRALRDGEIGSVIDLLAFFADRLKILLRDQGKRHDLVDAVFALGDDDLVRIVNRVESLDHFLKTDDGKSLLAGYKRAGNILKAEEKKGPLPAGEPSIVLATAPEEKALMAALSEIGPQLASHLQSERYVMAMTVLASLRGPLDMFFDKVLVNAEDDAVRENRLNLISQVRDAMHRVADFSLISG